jgi:hypothetical protein
MQVLWLSAAELVYVRLQAAGLYCVTVRSLLYAVGSSVHGRQTVRYVQRCAALNSAKQMPLNGEQQIDRSE